MGLLDGKVALGLAAAGASVVVNDYGVTVDGRDPSSERALGVVKEIEARGGRAVANADSVATMAGGQAMVDTALKTFGDLHIVVCCAGILKERMIFNMSEEEWDSVVAVHLKGHFTVMRPATRHMREHKYGRIVTFTSTAGLEGSPGQPNYSAAKEGIVGLTRSTALAMAKYGVTVNCISPTAETRMTERLPDTRRAQAAAPPEAIAPVVAFLARDHAPGGMDARGAGRRLRFGARSGSAAAVGRARHHVAAAELLALVPQGAEAGFAVGAAERESSRDPVAVELEGAQLECSRRRQQLHVGAGMLEARELDVAADLVKHRGLERFLHGAADRRRRRRVVVRRVAQHDQRAADRRRLERLEHRRAPGETAVHEQRVVDPDRGKETGHRGRRHERVDRDGLVVEDA